MLESAIKNYANYASYLSENTKQGLANLVLENMIPSKELMKNLVLRDTGKITNDEFLEIEMKRINGESAKITENLVEFHSENLTDEPLHYASEAKQLYAK